MELTERAPPSTKLSHLLLKSRGFPGGGGRGLSLLQIGHTYCVTGKSVSVLAAPSCPLLRAKDSFCHFKVLFIYIYIPAKYQEEQRHHSLELGTGCHQESKLAQLSPGGLSFHAAKVRLPPVPAAHPHPPQLWLTLWRLALEVSRCREAQAWNSTGFAAKS